MRVCHMCENQSHCQINGEMCGKDKDKFIPKEKVKHFFTRYCIGIDENGDRKYFTHVDLDNPDLKPTHSILVGGHVHCAYCGEKSMHVAAGYCCICDGALAEVQYNKELCELEAKHRLEMDELRKKWRKKLSFNLSRLLEVKQTQEKSRIDMWRDDVCHFMTINGNKITDLEDLL